MEHTISAVEDALNQTREAMYDAEEACGQAELLVVGCNLQIERCKMRLDELLEIRFRLPLQRLPSESTRGQAPQPY